MFSSALKGYGPNILANLNCQAVAQKFSDYSELVKFADLGRHMSVNRLTPGF
jgi:hypothetical protein